MYEKKIPELLDCGLSVAIKVLGGKWKAWIIECLRHGVKRPGELHKEMDVVSPRVISLHLRELEDYGIISKKVYAELPLKVEYYLTEVGLSLLPIMTHLEKWGNENRSYILESSKSNTEKDSQIIEYN
jgi:DNA-binding HxlR family transcriptional regulator